MELKITFLDAPPIDIKSHKVSASYSKAFQHGGQKHFLGGGHYAPRPMSNRAKNF